MRILTLIFSILILSPCAIAANYSNIVEVNVDVTSDNAAKARTIAMNQANRQAIKTVAVNFTTNDGLKIIDNLNDEQVLNFIKETTVLDEKASNVRYMGRFKITVHDEILKQYLQEKDVTVVTASSEDAIIIPIYHQSLYSNAILWENPNPWRKTWEKSRSIGTIRFSALSPRYNDVSAQKFLDLDTKALQQISAIEGTDNVYIVEATKSGDQQIILKITNSHTGKTDTITIGDGMLEETYDISSEDAETTSPKKLTLQELMEKAAVEAMITISDDIKNQSASSFDQLESVSVLYSYNNLSDWLNMQETLNSIPAIENIEIHAIGSGRVQFQVDYVGGVNNLNKTLYKNYLMLQEKDNFYILTRGQ